MFWELQEPASETWLKYQGSPKEGSIFDGKRRVILWEQGNGSMASSSSAYIRGQVAWDKHGITVQTMRDLNTSLFDGSAFDMNISMILPMQSGVLPAIWCFCSSPEYAEAVRQINQKLRVADATLVKVPFDLARWAKVAQRKYPHGLPKPCSDDPTQWIFHGHPAQSDAPLQVAVARLLDYRWPAEQDSAMELSDDARAWVKKSEALLAHADDDGIVCIPGVRGEKPAADRLRELVLSSGTSGMAARTASPRWSIIISSTPPGSIS
jgi:hypothetical protein